MKKSTADKQLQCLELLNLHFLLPITAQIIRAESEKWSDHPIHIRLKTYTTTHAAVFYLQHLLLLTSYDAGSNHTSVGKEGLFQQQQRKQ